MVEAEEEEAAAAVVVVAPTLTAVMAVAVPRQGAADDK